MKESLRQLMHLLFGLLIAGFIAVFPRDTVIPVLALSLFSGFLLSDAIARRFRVPMISPMIDMMERDVSIPGKGALYFALSALFCSIFFDFAAVVIAIVVLAVLDSATTYIGLRFGRHTITNGKTIEGTGGGILITWGALLPFLPPGTGLLVAAVGGIVELVSPIDDNLVLPVIICLLLAVIVPELTLPVWIPSLEIHL
jgi:phytol kinase